jgi:hypothetical protein
VRRSNSESLISIERLTVIVLGVYLAAVGLHMVLRGHPLYRNYLHTPVPAPVAVVLGLVLIIAGFVLRL